MGTSIISSLVNMARMCIAKPLLEEQTRQHIAQIEEIRERLQSQVNSAQEIMQDQVNKAYDVIFAQGEMAGRAKAITELEQAIESRRGLEIDIEDVDLVKKRGTH